MLDDTKLITKDGLSIFFIAIVASEGIFGESSIISRAMSFTESTNALNSLSIE